MPQTLRPGWQLTIIRAPAWSSGKRCEYQSGRKGAHMFLRHFLVMSATILAAVLAILFTKWIGGNPARTMQTVLYVFVGALIVGFVYWKRLKD
jgi:hypothetical protein